MCLPIEWGCEWGHALIYSVGDLCLSECGGDTCLYTEWGGCVYILSGSCVVCALDPGTHPLNLYIEGRNNVMVGNFVPLSQNPCDIPYCPVASFGRGPTAVTESVKRRHRCHQVHPSYFRILF